MRLTCPTCRSGLEVPDGTSALVRCPTCRGVFAPAAAPAPPAPPPARRPTPRPVLPAESPPAPKWEVVPDAPRSRFLLDKEAEAAARLAENRELRRAFRRAARGCRLIWVSFLLYGLSLGLIVAYFILTATRAGEQPGLVTAAGLLGLVNWVLGAVGLGFTLAGPDRPGLRGYGTVALAAAALHLALLAVAAGRPDAFGEFARGESEQFSGWAHLPTKILALTAYLTRLVYPDFGGSRGNGALFVAVGAAESLRLLFVVLALQALARAAGDDDLAYRCLRAASAVTVAPAALIVGMLGFTAFMVEANAQNGTWGRILVETARMGTHAILAGMLVWPTRCARDTADACEAPIVGREGII